MPEETNMDMKRKRALFALCGSIIVVAFLVLSVINYLERDFPEIVLNLVIIVIMVAGLVIIKTWDQDTAVYRIIHFLISLNFCYGVAIGAGQETVLYWVFLMPLLFFYFFGKREGLLWTVIFSFFISLIVLASGLIGSHSYRPVIIPRFEITLLIVIIIGYGLESSRDTYSRLLKEKNEVLLQEKERLERALAEIKTLSGLIPICCNCKKIRDDQGYWQQVETYVKAHTGADFSHGICPNCMEKLYPEYDQGAIKQTSGPKAAEIVPLSVE